MTCLVINLADTQQVIECGERGDLENTYIVPAKSRIKVDIADDKVEQLKAQFVNILAFRSL